MWSLLPDLPFNPTARALLKKLIDIPLRPMNLGKLLLLAVVVVPVTAFSQIQEVNKVQLLTQIDAPIIADGRQIGSMKLPPGSSVTVISSDGRNVMVRRGEGAPFPVPVSAISP